MNPLKISKKLNFFAVVFLLAIGIAIGGFLVLKSKTGTASLSEQLNKILNQGKEPVAACQPDFNNKTKDSDNDGLADWQEQTWQTDACKQDTDKDGYLDGEEVASGYDPTIKAPNDELAGQNSTKPRPLPNNLTYALAQSLSKRITEGEEILSVTDAEDPNAIDISNRTVNTAIQEVINQSINEFSLPNIPDEEIIISADKSNAAIRTYGLKVKEAMHGCAKNFCLNGSFESEAQLFYYAIQNKDFTDVDKLIGYYKKLYEDIKQIPVPVNLIEFHKEQLAIFKTTVNISQAIKEIDSDPLKAQIALEQYNLLMNLTSQLPQKLINQLTGK